jgi:serine/threonine protein kinase
MMPHLIVRRQMLNASPECKDLLLKMLDVEPHSRPSAEKCIQHPWFSQDRDALQSSLLINKNSELLASMVLNIAKADGENSNEFKSFMIAPNYFEMMSDSRGAAGGGDASDMG